MEEEMHARLNEPMEPWDPWQEDEETYYLIMSNQLKPPDFYPLKDETAAGESATVSDIQSVA